ncbi:AzlC family ABC transporter permease [Streptococcus moroccensis]|uniref:4-azaleucine resistance transporter AzlC n=1 Tax=Streptococcus moroccensis TaxID=1451356 RepID=A0ABT9YSC9_9STRE|nr:AzlC family ABC transporter permease [Streptococcus moroccensis]MDQ0222895.1 4-azaleucine resistance transporter AzlC [Streptococcus moroccensis]
MDKQAFRSGLKSAIPTGMGYLGIGLALGIIATTEGMSPFLVLWSSLVIYAGAGQFALVSLLATGASLQAIGMTIFLINLRHFLMGLHTATLFPSMSPAQTIGVSSLLTDETYGVMLGQDIRDDGLSPDWMLGNNILSYTVWVGATFLGALLGERVPDPYRLGLDYALLAMFIGIFSSQFRALEKIDGLGNSLKILGVVGLAFLVGVLVLPKSLAVLVATLLGCAVGVYLDEK